LLEVCKDLWVGEGGTLRVEKETDGCLFVDNFRAYAEQIVLKSEKEALHAMLRNRAARAAIVVQQPGATTSLLV
jgi:phage I-like protein